MALRDLRREKGFTQAELSKASGVSRGIIARTETGVTVPDVRTVLKLAQALDCTCDSIIKGLGLGRRPQRVS